jgi:hypothetical protein
MYTIANKHNKKTRKLSSSSRNKHKSKSKNKRKHKYTIGKTRKYTKSHNTIHIGGVGKGQGRQAVKGTIDYSAPSDSQRAAQRRVSERLKQARQSLSQNQPDVTVSDSRQVQTPTFPRRSAPPQKTSSTGAVTVDIPPPPQKITENTLLRPPQENVDEEENQRAESEAKKAEEESLKAQADAKKVQREERLQKKKENIKIESQKTYDDFITKINEYDFETSTEEPYIRFSKFIQEIMDLQFSIKDDEFRKKAQTITDQILNAYSALISYNCSTKFLKQHFQTYIKKLNIKKPITITDPKFPSLKIDEVDESITDRLTRLAQAQVCDHPLSEHLVKEPVTDSDSPFFRFPSLPSLRSLRNTFRKKSDSSNTRDTELNQTRDRNDKQLSLPPGSQTELQNLGDKSTVQLDEGRGRTRTSFDKLSSSLRGTTRTSAAAPPPASASASTTRSREAPASTTRSEASTVYTPPASASASTTRSREAPASTTRSEASTVYTPPAPASTAAQPSPTEHIYYRSPNNTILTFDIYKNDPEHPNKIVIKYRGYIGTSGNTGNFISDNIYRKNIPEADVMYIYSQGAYTLALILNQDQFSSLEAAAQNNSQWTLIPAAASNSDITFPGTWHSDEASAKSYIAVPASASAPATASASAPAYAPASAGAKPVSPSITNYNKNDYLVNIEPKSDTGGGGKNRIIIFSDDGLRFAWGKDKPNVTKRANTNISESKVDFPNQVILIKRGSDSYIKIDDVRKSQYHEGVCSDNDLCILVEGYTVTGTSDKAWTFTFSAEEEKNEFLTVLNELCENCVDENRKKIIRDIAKDKADKRRIINPLNPLSVQGSSAKYRPTSRELKVVDDEEPKQKATSSSLEFGKSSDSKQPTQPEQENVFLQKRGLLDLDIQTKLELQMDYNLKAGEIDTIIRENDIKSKDELIGMLKKRKLEEEKLQRQIQKDEAADNERKTKEAEQQQAQELMKELGLQGSSGIQQGDVDIQKLLTNYSPGYSPGSSGFRYTGGKKKRTKRNKRRSYRKNRRTKRNVYKNKNKKNKKHKK